MMSSISPVFSSEPTLANHVPALKTGFTPWDDASDLFSIFDSLVCPVNLNSGLEKMNSYQIQNTSAGLEEKPLNRTGSEVVFPGKNDRRKRRKISNRESARRSRMKKQKHFDDLTSQLNQLETENRKLQNWFRYVVHHCRHAMMENDRLQLEHHILHEKLLNLRQALVLRQFQQGSTCATWSSVNSTVVTVYQNSSMIENHVI